MTSSSEDGAREQLHLPAYEYAAVFEKTPGPCMILDPSFTIVAANDAYCAATMTERDAILARHLFEVFPDNPHESSADAVENLRVSLLRVLKSRRPDRMRIQKYDIRRRGDGAYEERHWSAINVPVLGPDGYVRWIVHSVEDVTDLVRLRSEYASGQVDPAARKIVGHLRETELQLAAAREENARLRESLQRLSKD
ncbi:MAG TPA: PAS domain-containing protein [Rhizomicrobium sp.]